MKNEIKFNEKFLKFIGRFEPVQISVFLFFDILIEMLKLIRELVGYVLSALFGIWLTIYFINSSINVNELFALFSQSIFMVFVILLSWFTLILIGGFFILERDFYKKTVYNMFIFLIGLFFILQGFLKYSILTQQTHTSFRFLSSIFFILLGAGITLQWYWKKINKK